MSTPTTSVLFGFVFKLMPPRAHVRHGYDARRTLAKDVRCKKGDIIYGSRNSLVDKI